MRHQPDTESAAAVAEADIFSFNGKMYAYQPFDEMEKLCFWGLRFTAASAGCFFLLMAALLAIGVFPVGLASIPIALSAAVNISSHILCGAILPTVLGWVALVAHALYKSDGTLTMFSGTEAESMSVVKVPPCTCC